MLRLRLGLLLPRGVLVLLTLACLCLLLLATGLLLALTLAQKAGVMLGVLLKVFSRDTVIA